MNFKDKPIIGVMGGAVCSIAESEIAFETGKRIAEKGGILLCGGGKGIMEAVSRGAKSADGLVIGIMPGSDKLESPPNPYVDIAIYTGMSDARNAVNAKSSDVVIAISGEFGTLSEIAFALKCGKKVIALKCWELFKAGNSPSNYYIVETAEEAVELAFCFLS
jgi:uncharacterized protein (TIGR00725 family)